jgi:DNA-binding MarR family transcriptional regulator
VPTKTVKSNSRPAAAGRPRSTRQAPVTDNDADALANALRVCIMRLARQLRTERNDTSLSFSQLSALGAIESRGPISPGQLAEFERIQPPAATRLITVLCERGYVVRRNNPADRRHALLEVTPKGRKSVRSDRERRSAWLVSILRTFTDEERAQLGTAIPHLERLIRTGIDPRVEEIIGKH